MLLVRAREACAACNKPSQGRLADGRAVCIGCALSGAPAPIGAPRDPIALVKHQAREGLVSSFVLSLSPTVSANQRNVGTLAAGREILRGKLESNTAGRETRMIEYNQFATELVKAVRAQTAGAHGAAASALGRSVETRQFADAAYALFQGWRNEPDEDRRSWRAGHAVFIEAVAGSLVESLTRQIGRFQARALLTDALGPFGTTRDSRLGRLLPRIGDEQEIDEYAHIEAQLTPPDTQELARRTDPLIESLTSRFISGDARFSTLDGARAELRQLYSGASTRTKGRKQYDDFDEFAAVMVREISANSAIRDTKGAAAFAMQPVVREQFTRAVGGLFADWMGTKYSGISPELIAKQAANMLFVALKRKLADGRKAHDMLVAAFKPLAPRTGLRRYLPRIGDEIGDDISDDIERVYVDELSDDDEAELGGDIGLIHPDSDLVGAEAVAMVQQIDASLLRRARDALQKVTKGKRYDTTRLEKALLRLFTADLRRGGAPGDNAQAFADGIATDLMRQKIVANSLSQGTREWANFVAMAGNEFYRADAQLPPQACRRSQDDFANANRGDVDYLVIADELVNMASFFNKRAFEAAAIPDADDDMLAPGGVIKLPKTAEYKQVAQDLQRIRASLIGQLNAVCAERSATVKQDKPLDAKAIVDNTLLTLFDVIWSKTVPHAAPDKMSFAQIYSMYSREPGTATQRRAAMLKKFFATKK